MPIKKITKQFNYSKADLIDLVLNIDDYQKFLPWCTSSKIIKVSEENKDLTIEAKLEIGFKSFKEVYTSNVFYNYKDSKITVTCIKGNIKKLLNIWEFKELDLNHCSVDFFIDIELKNPFINILFNKFFNYGFEKILESFEKRANETIKS